MSGDDVLPGYVLGGFAYVDGAFDRVVDWDADAKYVVERLANSHDLTHVLGGYGSDLFGEVILVPFQLTAFGVPLHVMAPLARSWGLLTAALFRPRIELATWVALCAESGERGAAMASRRPGTHVRFEDMLSLPLDEVRRQLGIPPHRHEKLVTEDGWLRSRSWSGNSFAVAYAAGYGRNQPTIDFARRIAPLVERGVTVRELMSAPRSQAWQAVETFEKGAPLADVRAALVHATAAA